MLIYKLYTEEAARSQIICGGSYRLYLSQLQSSDTCRIYLLSLSVQGFIEQSQIKARSGYAPLVFLYFYSEFLGLLCFFRTKLLN